MSYTVRGSLAATDASGDSSPVPAATVRLYATSGASGFAVLDAATVASRAGDLLAADATDGQGGFVVTVPDGADYSGEAVEVHVRSPDLPGGAAGDPAQARLTAFQPRWRQSESGVGATWNYTIPAAEYARFRSGGDATDGDDGADTGSGDRTFGVLSTPNAAVLGRSFNPVATVETADLLTSPEAHSFLRASGVDADGAGVNWLREPIELGSTEATLLDETVPVRTFGGILTGDPPRLVYVHLARAEAGDVVVTAGVHGVAVEDTTRPLVGPDGHATRSVLDARRATVANLNAGLVSR